MTTFSPEVQAILDRVKSGEEPPAEEPKRKRRVLTPEEKAERAAAKANKPKREGWTPEERVALRQYDYSLIAELFTKLHMNVTDITEYLNCSRHTVTSALNDAGIPMEERQIARMKHEMCKRGLHDMAENSITLKNGSRTCGPCKRRVQRIARRRREGKEIPPEDLAFLELG